MFNDPTAFHSTYTIPLVFMETAQYNSMVLHIKTYNDGDVALIGVEDVEYTPDYDDDNVTFVLCGVYANGMYTKNNAVATKYRKYITDHIDTIIDRLIDNKFNHELLAQLATEHTYRKPLLNENGDIVCEMYLYQLYNLTIVHLWDSYISNNIGVYKDGVLTMFDGLMPTKPEIINEINTLAQHNLLDDIVIQRDLHYIKTR